MLNKKKYWVARDADGLLYAYLREPRRVDTKFLGGTCMTIIGLNACLFEYVTWENSPWQISTD